MKEQRIFERIENSISQIENVVRETWLANDGGLTSAGTDVLFETGRAWRLLDAVQAESLLVEQVEQQALLGSETAETALVGDLWENIYHELHRLVVQRAKARDQARRRAAEIRRRDAYEASHLSLSGLVRAAMAARRANAA